MKQPLVEMRTVVHTSMTEDLSHPANGRLKILELHEKK